MQRIAAAIEYDGTNYHGWQIQDNSETVQEKIEQALGNIANHETSTICSGRTDAGVHARRQIIHFDTNAERENFNWALGCNTQLPPDIRVLWVQPVNNSFNARRSALWRRYVYIIYNSRVNLAIGTNYVSFISDKLDENAMQIAAKDLIGRHDFSSFRAASCQSKSSIRNLTSFTVTRRGNFIFFDIIASAFLHHMVRNMVGSLLEVGRGRRKNNWIKEVLLAKDRKLAGMTAAASGLSLFDIGYNKEFNLPNVTREWFGIL